MERERATPSLHQRIAGALDRGARAQEASRALQEDHERIGVALRDTIDAIRERRSAAARAHEPPSAP